MRRRPTYRFFHFFTLGVFIIFAGVMAFVVSIAFSRKPGSTGLSMFKVQQIRAHASNKQERGEKKGA